MKEGEGNASWNMAQQYYEMLMTFMSMETQAYADNDIRELWKWLTWLYDNVSMNFEDKMKEKLEEEWEKLDKLIYDSAQGDRQDDLYTDDTGSLEEFRIQLTKIRVFRRSILKEMQDKKMILPWKPSSNPAEAGVKF